MKILSRYLLAAFVQTFFMSLMVITFVVSIGALVKMTSIIARGVAWQPVIEVLLLSIPRVATYSIPMSVMVAAALVFGRLSSDQEVTAMKACGISIWSILAWPIYFSLLLSVFCMVLHNNVVPYSHLRTRTILRDLKSINALDLIEEGRFIEVSTNLQIYVGQKEGHLLRDVRLREFSEQGTRKIHAAEATAEPNDATGMMTIMLRDVQLDPLSFEQPGKAYMSKLTREIDMGVKKREYDPKETNMKGRELLKRAAAIEEYFPDNNARDCAKMRSRMLVEFNKRLALSLGCFIFAIVGIPLSIKSHRKDTAGGAVMSLLCIFVFYGVLLVVDSLDDVAAARPHLIIWLPIVFGASFGAYLLHRLE
jgi:lipopolysaccharide export system permease protein